jgi:amino acid permease
MDDIDLRVRVRNYAQIGVSLFFLFPLMMIKNMSGLAGFSVMSIVFFIYLVILMIVQFPSYYHHWTTVREPPGKIMWLPDKFDSRIIDAAGITFFAYTCHAGLFPIFSELKRPNVKRMQKVLSRSISINMVIYFTVAVVGYLSTF